MAVIFKFTIKNILKKKLRTFLIILAVVMASSLFFVSNGIASSNEKTTIDMLKSSYGSADVYITAGSRSPNQYVSLNKAEIYRDRVKYIIGETDLYGVYKINNIQKIPVYFKGIDYNDLMIMNPINLIQQNTIATFKENELIVSKKTADKYGFFLGKEIKVNIKGNEEKFKIVAIADQSSIFSNDENGIIAVAPRKSLCELNNTNGMVSEIYFGLKNQSKIDNFVQDLSDTYKNYDINKVIDEQEIEKSTQTTRVSFLMLLAVVMVMSIFIIYTAFKIIIYERIPIIGIFRSMGSTKFTCNIVLIAESLIYGILGGILGDICGISMLYLIAVLMNSNRNFIKTTISYDPLLIIETVIFAMMISFFSSLIPIVRVSKISIKDIILNNISRTKENGKKKFSNIILGSFLLIIIIMVQVVNNPKSKALAISTDLVAIISIISLAIILIPIINTAFSNILCKLNGFIFGNEGIIAGKNLKNDKNILNNISLLCISISTLFMINVISVTASQEIAKAYNSWNCDIVMYVNENSTLGDVENSRIKNTKNVSDALGVYGVYNTEVIGKNKEINCIQGIAENKFNDYINIQLSGGKKDISKSFNEGRNIIITDEIESSINAKIGDEIILDTVKGKKKYKIVGTFNSLMQLGSYAFIPDKYIKSDFNQNQYHDIFIKTIGDPTAVKNRLIAEFKNGEYTIETINDMKADTSQKYEDEINQLRIFPLISLIIGILGVINNFVISFMYRKHNLAIMVSVGISKKQAKKMILTEGFIVGFIGSITGVTFGTAMCSVFTKVMSVIGLPMNMQYDFTLYVECFALGIGIAMLASIAPILKLSKINIVESLKAE